MSSSSGQLVADSGILRQHRSYPEIRNQLIVLGLFPLSEAIAWTSIFPYIYAMVESFSAKPEQTATTTTESNTATYAAIMVSVFTFGEFIMAPQWARISDRIGRKPTLLVGSVGAMISALAFGFSNSLPMSIAARTFAGLANPNLGVVKTVVGELVMKEHQAKGFSVVPFLRGLGTIIGPVIGGYLAEPVKNHPSVFRTQTVWEKFPYLLPNLMVFFCLAISCLLCFLLMEEVHPGYQDGNDVGRRICIGIGNLLGGKRWNEDNVKSGYVALDPDENDIELATVAEADAETGDTGEPDHQPLNGRARFTRQVCLQILSSTILGYLKVATLATVPIFLATPSESTTGSDSKLRTKSVTMAGGLGLDTQEISNLLLVQAATAIITQITIVPKLIEKWGPLGSYRLSLSTLLCLYCVIPFAVTFPTSLGLVAVLLALCIYALVNGLVTTCSAILITNTVSSPAHLATVNGAAASLGCFARTLGPLVSGPLFRLGIQIGIAGLPFWALGAATGLGLAVATLLRDHP